MDENGDFIERLRHELLKVVTSVTIALLSRRAKTIQNATCGRECLENGEKISIYNYVWTGL